MKSIRSSALALITLSAVAVAQAEEVVREKPDAIERAIAYLAREVPAWRPENGCYSCHNNGDGARALYLARRSGRHVEPAALADTQLWLRRPQDWKAAGREEAGESGETLSAIQFGATLLEMIRNREGKQDTTQDREHLVEAAQWIAASQRNDGSWTIDAKGSLGAPATYGPFLATATGLKIMKAARESQFERPIEKAESWLRSSEPKSVLDASATLLGLAGATDAAAARQLHRSLEVLREAQQDSGGWGPFASAPFEPFDTAIALIALATLPEDPAAREMIRRGREHLLATQRESGSWPETTRPSGAASYAQHISTTAWALQALLVTQAPPSSHIRQRQP
jgi:hypothetical protein